MAGCLGGAAVLGGLALRTFEDPGLVTVLLAAGTAVLVALFEAFRGRAARLNAGIKAEQIVARVLESMPVGAVVHGAQLVGGDVDHVVLGPVLVAVETKHGRGELGQDSSGRLTVNGRLLPRDPVAQVVRQAQAVAKRTGRQCTPVVAVSEATGRPVMVRGVLVCSARDLTQVIRSMPGVVSPSEVVDLCQRLSN